LAYGLYATGQHDRLRATLREFESLDKSDPVGQAISYESELLRIRLEFIYGKYSRVSQMTDNLTPPNTAIYGRTENTHFSLYRNVLAALFYQQNYEKFSHYYEKVASGFSANSSPIGNVLINSFKAMNAFLQGMYIDANEYALAAVQLADEYGVKGSYFPFEAGYILMDTNLEFAEVEKSQGYVDKYLEYALACKEYTAIVAYFSKASLIQLQAGNVSGALALIRKGREKIDSPLFGQEISFVLDAHEVIIRIALGENERIAELLPRLENHKLLNQFKLAMELQRNPADAERTLKLFPTETVRDKFYKEYMSAIVFESKGPQAISHLEKAIEIAIPNGYFRSFLLSSPTLQNYLLDIAAKTPTVYMENLARAIREQSQAHASAASIGNTALTKRELDILRRLATGIPISQIAASVHISQNTIKTHLKNLYRKMNVESRDEAVERGKELSLL
jgi:DNA-binding CsgD family transcriptional regulator